MNSRKVRYSIFVVCLSVFLCFSWSAQGADRVKKGDVPVKTPTSPLPLPPGYTPPVAAPLPAGASPKLKATVLSPKFVRVGWGVAAGASDYTVWQAAVNTGPFFVISTVQATVQAGDFMYESLAEQTSNSTRFYKVSANYPKLSPGVSVVVGATTPPANNPSGFTATAGAGGDVILTWNPVPTAISYSLHGPMPPMTPAGPPIVKVSGTTYTVKGLPSGTHSWSLFTNYYSPTGEYFVESNPAYASYNTPPSEFRISVLTLNLRGTNERWGGINEGQGATVIPWIDRYDRIAIWMRDTNTTPDVIALEEVRGYWECPWPIGIKLRNYDTLFGLISRIRSRTNISYRIAYLAVGPVQSGACTFISGVAVLYNPARIRNVTRWSATDRQWPYNDTSVRGVHLRQSHPCKDLSPQYVGQCGLIDGAGLSWVSSYSKTSGGWAFGSVFAEFELVKFPGERFHIYNVHLDTTDTAASFPAVRRLVDQMEQRFGNSSRLYAPIIAGDFNIGLVDMQNETTGVGTFQDFRIAGYSVNDVVGILVGEFANFPSKIPTNIESSILPTDILLSGYCGGSISTIWSDHCGVLVRFTP